MSVSEQDTGPWYYYDRGRTVGPLTWDHLLALSRSGAVDQSTEVWQTGSPTPQPFSRALEAYANDNAPVRHEVPLPALEPGWDAATAPFSFGGIVQPRVSAAPSTIGPIATVTTANGWSNMPVAPWRRYGARFLDTVIHGTIGLFVVTLIVILFAPLAYYQFIGMTGGVLGLRLVEYFLTTLLAVPIGALLLGLSGSTLGKIIFGVKVHTPEGRPIGIARAMRREFHVWIRGMGFGFVPLTLICFIGSKLRLERDRITPWDESGPLLVMHRPAGDTQTILNIFGIVLILLTKFLL